MKKIMPVNTSGRTATQIVAEAEATWMLPHVYIPESLRRGPDCRYMKCHHKTVYAGYKQLLASFKPKEAQDDRTPGADRTTDSDVVQAGAWPDAAGVR